MGNGDKTTIATPPQVVDVMIVPHAPTANLNRNSNLTIFQQNWLFAKQWREASPGSRAIVEVPINGTLAQLEAAAQAAAAKAAGTRVILCVGHGGAGSFRGLTQSVFDSMPETAPGMMNHVGAMTSEVIHFLDIAEKKNGRWVPKQHGLTIESQAKIDSLSPRFDSLVRVGKLLQDGHVHDFTILSCNAGLDTGFGSRLASLLGVETHLYSGLVAMAESSWMEPGKPDKVKEQAWIVSDPDNPEGNRPPTADPDHASYHEIPTDRERRFTP